MTLGKEEQTKLAVLVQKAKEKFKVEKGIELTGNYKIDLEKNIEENRALIIQMIKSEVDEKMKNKPVAKSVTPKVSTTKKESSEEKKREQERLAKEEAEKIKKLKEEEERVITEWKSQFNPEMVIKSPAYFEMENYIEMVCEGFSNFCIVSGAGGLAKTWSSQAILTKKQVKYAYLNSFTTPLELYNFLYDHRQGYVVLIDDCEGIWENKPVISIMKNATELNGKRVISWNSTTSRLEGRPNSCEFDSRIILLTNKLPSTDKNEHIGALLSRAYLAELQFSYQEKMDIIKEVSKKDYEGLKVEDRQKVMQFLERNTSPATKNLSIRTLIKCYNFYRFKKTMWEKLASMMLEVDDRKELVFKLMNSGKPVETQVDEYCRMAGRSRADFYRIKGELMPKVKHYVAGGSDENKASLVQPLPSP